MYTVLVHPERNNAMPLLLDLLKEHKEGVHCKLRDDGNIELVTCPGQSSQNGTTRMMTDSQLVQSITQLLRANDTPSEKAAFGKIADALGWEGCYLDVNNVHKGRSPLASREYAILLAMLEELRARPQPEPEVIEEKTTEPDE